MWLTCHSVAKLTQCGQRVQSCQLAAVLPTCRSDANLSQQLLPASTTPRENNQDECFCEDLSYAPEGCPGTWSPSNMTDVGIIISSVRPSIKRQLARAGGIAQWIRPSRWRCLGKVDSEEAFLERLASWLVKRWRMNWNMGLLYRVIRQNMADKSRIEVDWLFGPFFWRSMGMVDSEEAFLERLASGLVKD